MKANQKIRENDEPAVSAVIGVTLMVTVTVAMGAVAYAYFTGMIGKGEQPAPVIEFVKDEINDRIKIVNTDPGIEWNEIAIRTDADDVTYAINTEINSTGGNDLPQNVLTSITTGTTIAASDFIDLEGHNGTAGVALSDVTIIIVHVESDTVIANYIFQTIFAAG